MGSSYIGSFPDDSAFPSNSKDNEHEKIQPQKKSARYKRILGKTKAVLPKQDGQVDKQGLGIRKKRITKKERQSNPPDLIKKKALLKTQLQEGLREKEGLSITHPLSLMNESVNTEGTDNKQARLSEQPLTYFHMISLLDEDRMNLDDVLEDSWIEHMEMDSLIDWLSLISSLAIVEGENINSEMVDQDVSFSIVDADLFDVDMEDQLEDTFSINEVDFEDAGALDIEFEDAGALDIDFTDAEQLPENEVISPDIEMTEASSINTVKTSTSPLVISASNDSLKNATKTKDIKNTSKPSHNRGP